MREQPISRRKAVADDLTFLVKLRHETMSPHLAASGVEQSEAEHLRRVLMHFESAEILLQDQERVGLVKVVRNGLNWELVQVQLCPSHQGRGVGSKLVSQLMSEAQAVNATLQLRVLKANPARRMYERLGFEVVSEHEHSFKMQRLPNAA
jgi:ribosomal protein S18 acetylase RimI-like enzyme